MPEASQVRRQRLSLERERLHLARERQQLEADRRAWLAEREALGAYLRLTLAALGEPEEIDQEAQLAETVRDRLVTPLLVGLQQARRRLAQMVAPARPLPEPPRRPPPVTLRPVRAQPTHAIAVVPMSLRGQVGYRANCQACPWTSGLVTDEGTARALGETHLAAG